MPCIEYLQAERFTQMGITAAAVNGQVWNHQLHKVCVYTHTNCTADSIIGYHRKQVSNTDNISRNAS